jgi:hypothetical protein
VVSRRRCYGHRLDRHLVSRHSSTGSPPPQGVIGIGLSLIGAVAGHRR